MNKWFQVYQLIEQSKNMFQSHVDNSNKLFFIQLSPFYTLQLYSQQLKDKNLKVQKMSQTSNLSLQQNQSDKLLQPTKQQSKKNKILLTIFIIAVIGFVILIYNRPPLNNSQVFQGVSFPPTPHDLYNISKVLTVYTEEHFYFSLFAFIYLYTLLQAFAIPGPVFLCILSPTLFGPYFGYLLSLSCSCLGASLCFFMSYTLARELVLRKFPALFEKFNNMVRANEKNLFWYMMFLRLTPLIPNWFVNLGSPLVGMPYVYFIVASFFGLMPNNFILIQTGLTLKEIDKIGVSPKAFVSLLALGFLALIPTFISKRYEKKITEQQQYAPVSDKEEQ